MQRVSRDFQIFFHSASVSKTTSLIKTYPILFPSCASPLISKNIILQWHHNGHDVVSNHQPDDCLFNRLFMHRSKKTSKLRVTGPCARNSPVAGEFPAQRASNAENVSIWWRHHDQRIIKILHQQFPYWLMAVMCGWFGHHWLKQRQVGTKPLPKQILIYFSCTPLVQISLKL